MSAPDLAPAGEGGRTRPPVERDEATEVELNPQRSDQSRRPIPGAPEGVVLTRGNPDLYGFNLHGPSDLGRRSTRESSTWLITSPL